MSLLWLYGSGLNFLILYYRIHKKFLSTSHYFTAEAVVAVAVLIRSTWSILLQMMVVIIQQYIESETSKNVNFFSRVPNHQQLSVFFVLFIFRATNDLDERTVKKEDLWVEFWCISIHIYFSFMGKSRDRKKMTPIWAYCRVIAFYRLLCCRSIVGIITIKVICYMSLSLGKNGINRKE